MISESQAYMALPREGFLRSYCAWAIRVTDAPLAYHVAGGLAALAAAAPPNLAVPWGGSWIYANLWPMLVGRSGEDRKTTAIGMVLDVLSAQCSERLGDQPGTREAAYKSLAERPTQLVAYPEFGDFLAATIRGYAVPLRPFYMAAFDCRVPSRVLMKARTEVRDPRLSLLAGIAPALLSAYVTPTDLEGGFVSRFLLCFARRERTLAIPPTDGAERERLSSWLFGLMTDGRNPASRCAGFDEAAASRWTDWFNSLSDYRTDERLTGARSRIPIMVLKTALLLSFDLGAARQGGPWRIPLVALDSALVIGALHYNSIMAFASQVAENPEMRDRAALLRCVGAEWTSKSSIYRGARLGRRQAAGIIDLLLEEQTIEALPQGSTTLYRIRPEL